MRNCMTYALDIENMELKSTDSILTPYDVRNSFEKLGNEFRRKFRKLDSENSPLFEGEWLILFLGLKVVHRDYEHIPDKWEYHFARKVNGVWLNRPDYGSEEVVPFLDEERDEMVSDGYQLSFFAIRKDE